MKCPLRISINKCGAIVSCCMFFIEVFKQWLQLHYYPGRWAVDRGPRTVIISDTPKHLVDRNAFSKKQVNGVGGLALLTIKNLILHIYICQSRIMQFLHLKLFFYFAENPAECFSLSESITNLNDPFEGSVGTEYRSNEKYATIHTQIVLVQYQFAQIFW